MGQLVIGRIAVKPLLATMRISIISILFISQVFSSPLPQDPDDDAEVFGGPVRTNTDYESDFIPGGFGGFRPRVRVVVLPIGDSSDTDLGFSGQRPHSFGNVFNILRSILGSRPSLVPSAEDDSTVPEDKKPCFICSFFKDSFDDVQDHINTTVIADTDEDGNSFYFHRAVFHNIGNSEVS